MEDDGNFGQRFAPVNVGDELDVKIEAVGEKGDGIAKKEGFVLFVPNTKEGQEVRIRITKVLRKMGFAEVVGESEAAPNQEESPAEGEAQSEETQEKQEPAAEQSEENKVEDTEDFGEEEKKE